jgi:general secretion pathway protein M
LVEFLQAIENGPGVVKVKYLRLEPRPQNETITAWLTIATYRLKN